MFADPIRRGPSSPPARSPTTAGRLHEHVPDACLAWRARRSRYLSRSVEVAADKAAGGHRPLDGLPEDGPGQQTRRIENSIRSPFQDEYVEWRVELEARPAPSRRSPSRPSSSRTTRCWRWPATPRWSTASRRKAQGRRRPRQSSTVRASRPTSERRRRPAPAKFRDPSPRKNPWNRRPQGHPLPWPAVQHARRALQPAPASSAVPNLARFRSDSVCAFARQPLRLQTATRTPSRSRPPCRRSPARRPRDGASPTRSASSYREPLGASGGLAHDIGINDRSRSQGAWPDQPRRVAGGAHRRPRPPASSSTTTPSRAGPRSRPCSAWSASAVSEPLKPTCQSGRGFSQEQSQRLNEIANAGGTTEGARLTAPRRGQRCSWWC